MKSRLLSGVIFFLLLMSCNTIPTTEIDKLFHDYQGRVPGAAVMVIQKGEILVNKSYGFADLERGIHVTDSTNFRLASVTKQFTAMAILQLIEAGEINFNTRLSHIFPEFPVYAEKITYGHLLHHTSGLVDYEAILPDTLTVALHDLDVLELILTQDSTYYEPGNEYSYSNGGYAILALTVERVSGMPFQDYLDKHIFTPLGMDHTLAFVKGKNVISKRAYGYHVDGRSVRLSDQSLTSSVLGDGGIYSSLQDMYKWDQALYGSEIISNASIDSAFTPWLENYGCGWRIEDYKGVRRVSHTGGTCGFRNVYQRFPDSELTIIIFTNRRDPGVQYLAENIADLFLP